VLIGGLPTWYLFTQNKIRWLKMSKTYWCKISKLEDKLENQDTTFIIKYIKELKKHNLLTRDMLAAIPRATMNDLSSWNLLHELAGKENLNVD
jgi:hypothetical protein